MKILLVGSEAAPFMKTGGLADVLGALPKALNKLGLDARVMMPLYKKIKDTGIAKPIAHTTVHMGHKSHYVGLYYAEHENITFYFIDNNDFFYRDGSPYGFGDDGERFTFFCLAVLASFPHIHFFPDILHLNDWQTGLIPHFLKAKYHYDPAYQSIKTLFSIHNIQYQGNFPQDIHLIFNVPYSQVYEHFNQVNFMKAAIVESDRLSTVSPTYRNEIMSSYYGYGLDGLLRERHQDLMGIINGIDNDVFNPMTDHYLEKNYHADAFARGKNQNKKALQRRFGLPLSNAPLIGFVSRLVEQKGIDLMVGTLHEVIEANDVQCLLMGSGDSQYEKFFESLAWKFPHKVKCYIGYEEGVAQQIYAGSDLFLMPSKFEPCGLGQLIAFRYGSIPIVRETGGLKDTIKPYNRFTQEGTGFSFTNYNAHEFKHVLEEAIYTYRNNPKAWKALVKRAMLEDFSWQNSAQTYHNLYQSMMKGRA